MNLKTRIYAADDDPNILSLIKLFLENEGYSVEVFDSGDLLYEAFKSEPCDLVILDIMMPGTDGITICNQIRKNSSVPIIMLTAKDTDADYITGITAGSDDYFVKPFKPTVFTVRVKALLRRIEMERGSSKNSNQAVIQYGDLEYNENKHFILAQGKKVSLTETELKLMDYILKNKEDAISKEALLENVWGMNAAFETRVVDETVRRTRKKLKLVKSNVMIRTIWGFGYQLDISEESL